MELRAIGTSTTQLCDFFTLFDRFTLFDQSFAIVSIRAQQHAAVFHNDQLTIADQPVAAVNDLARRSCNDLLAPLPRDVYALASVGREL